MPAQIGWGIKEKLLYKLKQIIKRKATPSAQEIGWGVEEKLLYQIGVDTYKANEGGNVVYSTTTSTTTSGIDADAAAWFAASGTDVGKQAAYNQFFLDIKAVSGLFPAIRAGYLMVNGTLAKDKFNIKNPLDTDGAFRLTGSASHSTTGVTGILQTKFNMLSSGWTTSNIGISIYNETDAAEYKINMGAGNAATGGIGILTDNGGGNTTMGIDPWNYQYATGVTDDRGFYTITGDGVTEYAFKDGAQLGSRANITALYNSMVLIGDQGSDAAGAGYLGAGTRKQSFAFIHDHLTLAQHTGLRNALLTLRTALGGF